MKIFITGTDTNVGKTIISSWMCLHTKYSYFKPIQTGCRINKDSFIIQKLSNAKIHKEYFSFNQPLSPHFAALLTKKNIDINKIIFPDTNNVIIEGIGGILVPINKHMFIIDFVKKFSLPTILVARSTLGTINHTLLSIEAMRTRKINILGVILNGPYIQSNIDAIQFYGKVKVLFSFPKLKNIDKNKLYNIQFPSNLRKLFENS